MIDSSGAVSGISIDHAGSGYNASQPVTVTFGSTTSGSGAAAATRRSPGPSTASPSTRAVRATSWTPAASASSSTPCRASAARTPTTWGSTSGRAPRHEDLPGQRRLRSASSRCRSSCTRTFPATTLRLYVQLNQGTDANGVNDVAPDAPPEYMGPMIEATAGHPVRVKFVNMLPKSQGAWCEPDVLPQQNGTINGTAYNTTAGCGDLFLPVDTNVMGSGMGPLGMNTKGKPMDYAQNRATIHLHGGKTPWISDGTPHQWITPTGENTAYPKGVLGLRTCRTCGSTRTGTLPRSRTPPTRRTTRRRVGDLLLHQPAVRPDDVLPRPLVRHHAPERVRRRGGAVHHPRRRREGVRAGHG